MNDAPEAPRDPTLSSLYRKASQGEPPPALDATILAAARAAAASQRPPRPWWRRLQAPLALAASVVLAVVLTLSMDRNPPADGEIPAAKAHRESAPATEQNAPAHSNAVEARSLDAPAREEAPRPPAVPAKQKPAISARESAPSAPPAAGAVKPEASATQGAPAPAADAGSADRLGNQQRSAIAEPAAAPAREAKREAAAPLQPPKPEAWIEEIRSLRRQGHPAEAERNLREFRAAYPDYPLPEDLR